MWVQSHSVVTKGIQSQQVWKVWSDVPNRPQWDDDIEWAAANGSFEIGTILTIKPKEWPKTVSMEITDCIPNKCFTDHTKFFGASLYGSHQIEEVGEGLRLTTTIKVTGPLFWLWVKLVAKDIVATLPKQTELLIQKAREAK